MMAAYQQPYYGGPNPSKSGSDPRGRTQRQSGYQQQRFENQQGPAASEFARQFGRAAESQYGDYGNIMKRYGDLANKPGGQVSYTDPFESYGGYKEFSQTGGYSPTDIANMRARGVSPIRSAYANAQRGIGQQRSLQGGYSPNAIATRAKMAREQGQSMADATQNVEAGLAEARNRGRLAGLGGMSDIEKQRLNAQLEAGMFNAREMNQNQLGALQGMTSLYGSTPGMANTFGDQLNTSIGQGGTFGLGLYGRDIEGQQLPGAWDQTMGRAGDIMDLYGVGSTIAYPWLRDRMGGQQQPGLPQGPNQYGSGTINQLPPFPGSQRPGLPQGPNQYGSGTINQMPPMQGGGGLGPSQGNVTSRWGTQEMYPLPGALPRPTPPRY